MIKKKNDENAIPKVVGYILFTIYVYKDKQVLLINKIFVRSFLCT